MILIMSFQVYKYLSFRFITWYKIVSNVSFSVEAVSWCLSTICLKFRKCYNNLTNNHWGYGCFLSRFFISLRVTSFITAFISLERCLCITLPMKVKNIITPLRTAAVTVSIFIIIFTVFSPFYFVNKLEWRYNQFLNRTILSLVYTEDRVLVESVTFPIHSVAMPLVSFLTVVVCTTILTIQLKRKSRWREVSTAQRTSQASTTKEKKVVKMVIFLSTIFIICYLPSTFNFFIMTYNPEFSITGKYASFYMVVWSLTVLVETVNSSVNMLVYLKMSSKFRITFVQTFCSHVK